MKKRSFGLDLVRSVALFFVALVHSFMYSGFNGSNLNNINSFILLTIRCVAFIGVLLFMILTGYLKSNKKMDKNHYKSIKKILIVYFIISIISIIFKVFVCHENKSLIQQIIGIFKFTAAPYSWYVNMYIGLFLLMPFLNILYTNIDSKRHKQFLILTLFVLGSLFPTMSRLVVDNIFLNITPAWWAPLYPLLMYFVGCYIKEYKVCINKFLNICLIFLCTYLQSIIYYFYAQGNSLNDILTHENSTFSIIIAILVFLFLYNIKTFSKVLSSIVCFISNASFGAYLISYCFDTIFYVKYPIFNSNSTHYYFKCTFIIPFIVFSCSILSSAFINLIINKITKYIKIIYQKRQLKMEGMESF